MTLTSRGDRLALHRRFVPRGSARSAPAARTRLASVPKRQTVAAIESVAHYLPERLVTSTEVEERIRENSPHLTVEPGLIERLTGVRSRHFRAEGENASDLAVAAASIALDRAGLDARSVDLLIFASSSQDLVEPATSHIVQAKLGTRAVVFDLKNACNSFIQATHVAEQMIASGQYRRILVCTGEAPSTAVRWRVRDDLQLMRGFAGYTLGDAGAAAVLVPSDGVRGYWHHHFAADSRHWATMMLPAGGTMFPRDEDATYFSGDGSSLKHAFDAIGAKAFMQAFADADVTLEDFDVVLAHQVTLNYTEVLREITGLAPDRLVMTIPTLGNIASATLPLQLDLAMQDGRIARGSRVLALGLGAGVSVGIQMFTV